jgi:hypothetical protein
MASLSFRPQEEWLMNQTTAMVLIVGLVVVLAVAWMYFRQKRSKDLRTHFGPEYDRLIHEKGSQGRAEAELDKREQRVKTLSIRPLPRDASARYAQMWNAQQTRFVDEPKAAVVEADHLVEEVMKERGYPVGEFDQRAADISVDHPHLVENYRAAHEISLREQRGQASTEDLRAAMIYYRDLFRELLDEPLPLGVTNQ